MDELTPERFYDHSAVSDAAVSPDGGRVAFVVTDFDADADDRLAGLFVAPTDGSEDPYRLTRASRASNPQWSPDGDKLAFLAAREEDSELKAANGAEEAEEDDGDDENDEPVGEPPHTQVWSFDLDRGGDARQVTDRDYGVSAFDWGPDGERVVVAARDPTDEDEAYLRQREDDGPIEIDRLQHKTDADGWMDEVPAYLFVVDVRTRDAVRLDDAYDAEKGDRVGLQPAWSPDGDRIAFVANHETDPDTTHVREVYSIRPDGTGSERLTDEGLSVSAPRWSPDGDRLAIVGGHPTNWYRPREAHVVDAETGEATSVSASLDRTVAFDGAPRWLDGETLVGLFGDEGTTRPVRLDADRDAPERVFAAQGRLRSVAALDVARDGSTLAFRLDDPEVGADVYTLARADLDAADESDAAEERDTAGEGDTAADGEGDAGRNFRGERLDPESLTRISRVNGDLVGDEDCHRCVRLSWENADGQEIPGLAYLPADFDPDDPDPRPVVSAVHGGPMSYDEPVFEFEHLFWTSRGYVVLRTNYRGSTSYGREFAERLRGTRGDKEVDDVVAGVDHLVERGWADEDRLYLTGFSYGGITTGAAVTRTDRFAAAAAEHGVYDFYSVFGTDDNHLWHEDEFGLPWENVEKYRDISAITDVGEVETPLLVTAGQQDWRCPPTQAEQLYVSVRKQGVDARLVVYPDEHHNVGDPDRAIHRLRELSTWFEEH